MSEKQLSLQLETYHKKETINIIELNQNLLA